MNIERKKELIKECEADIRAQYPRLSERKVKQYALLAYEWGLAIYNTRDFCTSRSSSRKFTAPD